MKKCLLRVKSRGLSRAPLGRQRGFTLIEVLIATMLLAMIVGAAALIEKQNLHSGSYNKHKLQATGLAQEGLNLVRSIRDTNLVNSESDTWTGLNGNDKNKAWQLQKDGTGKWSLIDGQQSIPQNGITYTRTINLESLPGLAMPCGGGGGGMLPGSAHLFINNVDKGRYIETSLGIGKWGTNTYYEASWTTETNQLDSSAESGNPLQAARNWLISQNPEIKYIADDGTGTVLGTAHLFINGVDKGKFIEASIGNTVQSGSSGFAVWMYHATWTAKDPNTGIINNMDFTGGWTPPFWQTGFDGTKYARDRLIADNPEVKFVADDGTILGTAHLFINGVDKGNYIETSIGSYGLPGTIERMAEGTWTAKDPTNGNINQWHNAVSYFVGPVWSSPIPTARSLLNGQFAEVRSTSDFCSTQIRKVK